MLVAIFASYVALNLAHSVTQAKGKAQAAWLAIGAIAMGVGIWSMHFVGMLAFEMPGMEMAYDVPFMLLSVVVAILASALALFVVSRPIVTASSILSGGIAMAAAIAGMHYIGMFSMRMAARIEWNLFLVVLSIVIALVASFAALWISVRLRNNPERLKLLVFASILMGVAISGMHYTGMVAATFVHDDSIKITNSHLLVTSGLTMAVIATTLLILCLALAGSVGQRLWTLRTKITEDIVNSSEEKFRMLVEAVKDYAIFMLDLDGNITTWNSGAERITGYKDGEVIGKHVSILYSLDDAQNDTTSRELRDARETGHFEGEAIRVRKDGTKFLANVVITPLFGRDGGLKGYSKVTRDITLLKASDARMRNVNEELEQRVRERTTALQGREAQLQTITNALPVLVAQFDKQERITFANESFCDWFQVGREEITNLSFSDILGERYEANKEHFAKALRGESVTYERKTASAGRHAIMSITCVPEFDDHEKKTVKGFIIVATEVSKYKEIEGELKAAKEAAEVANATKSAFLANMSHEIRTPLGAILGFSELMMSEAMSASEKVNNVEIIKRNGKLLSNIINDILDLSKVEAGKLQIEKTEVKILALLNEVASLMNLEAQGKGIKLTISSEGAIPSRVITDPTRLKQILFNIIGNAIKFTERGSVDVKVQLVPSRSAGTKLAFSVKDTGTGISTDQSARLFEPFMQADVTTTRKFGGTGLGLVLSKKLAAALGGDVRLDASSPGEGSTFVVTIDPGHVREVLFESSASSSEDGAEKNVIRISTSEPVADLRHLEVLIVDDSSDNRALVKKILMLSGVSVDVASNGREGMEKALAGDFDLVLMDLQMPEMDGYEATRNLRTRGYKKPIIALTAHAMTEERKRCLESGFNDHLTKPIDRESLVRTLAEYSA
ncbi:MAG: MHYT domain-containing protein [Bdellovibrionota bacterium]